MNSIRLQLFAKALLMALIVMLSGSLVYGQSCGSLALNPITGMLDCTGTSGSATGDVTAAANFGTNESVIVADGTGKGVKASTCTISGGVSTCPGGYTSGTGAAAGEVKLYELTASGSEYVSWLAPDAITTTQRLKPPIAANAANQVMRFGAPSSNTSQATWFTPVASIAAGTSTINPGAITSETCATVISTAANGVLSTDAIIVTPNASIKAVTGYVALAAGGIRITGYPTADFVNWDVCNPTSSSITPGSITLNWLVVGAR